MTENRMKANAVLSVLKYILQQLIIFMLVLLISGLALTLYKEYKKALKYQHDEENRKLMIKSIKEHEKQVAERLATTHVQVAGITPYLKNDFTVGHRNIDNTGILESSITTLLDQMAEGPERTKFVGALKSSKCLGIKAKKRKPTKKAKK